VFTIQFRPSSLDFVSTQTNFYPEAKNLRAHFESTFANPLQAKSERFCWDYWSVPNQYRQLRTPAEDFFGRAQFQNFLSHLLAWGRENLGCQISTEVFRICTRMFHTVPIVLCIHSRLGINENLPAAKP
jgi:hypothetical protein